VAFSELFLRLFSTIDDLQKLKTNVRMNSQQKNSNKIGYFAQKTMSTLLTFMKKTGIMLEYFEP